MSVCVCVCVRARAHTHVCSCEHHICPAHPSSTPHSQPFKSLGVPHLPQSPAGQFHSCLAVGPPQFQYERGIPIPPLDLDGL